MTHPQTARILHAAEAIRAALLANEAEIEKLDRAIGDGDHFLNMKRGAETVAGMAGTLAEQSPDAALKAIAMKLMSTIGGASGPLISSFFLAMSKTPGAETDWTLDALARMVRAGTDAIRARGKADLGDKTMLDVLIPATEALERAAAEGASPDQVRAELPKVAEAGMIATRDLMARKGRAAFLGERALGVTDPGAMSCRVMIGAVCAMPAETA